MIVIMDDPTKEKLIELIREIARKAGIATVPRHQFLRQTGLSAHQIYKNFDSYNALVEAAGLHPLRFPNAPIYSDDELLDEVVRVLRLPGAKVTGRFFARNSSVSMDVCKKRFGGWSNTLKSAATRLDPSLDAALIAKIQEHTSPVVVTRRPSGNHGVQEGNETSTAAVTPSTHPGYEFIPYDGANVYGDFINFRGLQHTPVNEQGVVFLFGMICRELGYVVETIRSGFPDCEAKRQIRGRPGQWQRVRIEFEYQSRTFQTHGHDPALCDVIVCWEHNWTDCPLEVVELKSALQRLPSGV